MKIISLKAENVKKLKVVEIKPSGAVVQVTGANGSGKSSVLDSIYYALAGTKTIPSKPVRNGTMKAVIKLDLGEVVVTRRFTETDSSLIVEGEKGARFPSPQKMLDELLGSLTFDPLAFSRMDPKKQLETLRGMVTLEEDIDALDADNYTDFTKRTEINREHKSVQAQADAITVHEGTPDKPLDVSALLEDLQKAGTKNADTERVKASAKAHVQAATDATAAANRIRQQIKNLEEEIRKLEQTAQRETREAQVAIPATIDTTVLREKVETAQNVNAQVEYKRKRGELTKQAEALHAQSEVLTNAIEERTQRKNQAIANAKMPVDGLSFGSGEVKFNGLPLNQASDAEQLRVSVAIAMAANPKLRVLRIKDGSLLDDRSMALIEGMAQDKDFQIWIEQVDTTGKVGIFMEDGMVKAVNA